MKIKIEHFHKKKQRNDTLNKYNKQFNDNYLS